MRQALRILKFAKRSEQMSPDQASLLDDLVDTDIAATEAELQALQIAPAATKEKQKPKRTALPAKFPRTLIHHEPDNTHCPCGCALKRIGEDVSEKLIQAPVPAQVIDKGISTAGSLCSGKRAAAIMSLIQSARLNGHDPYAYLKDVLTRLPT